MPMDGIEISPRCSMKNPPGSHSMVTRPEMLSSFASSVRPVSVHVPMSGSSRFSAGWGVFAMPASGFGAGRLVFLQQRLQTFEPLGPQRLDLPGPVFHLVHGLRVDLIDALLAVL